MKLNNNQVQVILTGTFGDGSVRLLKTTASYTTNCKMKDYLEFKKELLGNIDTKDINRTDINGFSQTYIWNLRTNSHPEIKEIHEKSLIEKLSMLDELGIAMWMYDDGSLHNRLRFYNLNTHAFSEQDNRVISDFLNKRLGIYSRVMIERKKDGRVFYYIYIPPCGGAYKLSDIMSQFPIESYKYKIIPEEEIIELRVLHNHVDKFHKAGTEEHYNMTTSLRRRLSGYRKKNKELSVEDFLNNYSNRPKFEKKRV